MIAFVLTRWKVLARVLQQLIEDSGLLFGEYRIFEVEEPDVLYTILAAQPSRVLAFGKPALEVLFGRGAPSTKEFRALPVTTEHGLIVYPTFDSKSLFGPRGVAEIAHDIGVVVEGVETRVVKTDYGVYVHDLDDDQSKTDTDHLEDAEAFAIDTEYERGKVLMLTYSIREGHGRAIYPEQHDEIEIFQDALVGKVVYLHNALADWMMLLQMGIDLSVCAEVRDTMLYAQYRGGPQGLKWLTKRYLGREAASYDSIVFPSYDQQVRSWVARVLEAAPREFKQLKSGRLGRGLVGGAKAWPLYTWAKKLPGATSIKGWEKRLKNAQKSGRYQEAEAVAGPLKAVPSLSNVGLRTGRVVTYACSDADHTGALETRIRPARTLAVEQDIAAIPFIVRAQERGLLVDREALASLRTQTDADFAESLAHLRELTWPTFAPTRPTDLMLALYGMTTTGKDLYEMLVEGDYPLPPGFTMKGRPKTDKKALAVLVQNENKLAAALMKHAKLAKLKGTYVDPLETYLDSGGVLHPNFRHTVIPSGRLSAVAPNVLAMGPQMRSVFVPRPGYTFVSFDLSQIELRVVADLAQDTEMLRAFREGADLYARVAALLGVQRTPAKITTLSIVYGATHKRVHAELVAAGAIEQSEHVEEDPRKVCSCSLCRTKKIVDDWFLKFSGVKTYIHETHSTAKHQGWIKDMWGRQRDAPGARLQGWGDIIGSVRSGSLRALLNHTVQGGAAGVIKIAMAAFTKVKTFDFYPLLQIHDELLFEVRDEQVEAFVAETKSLMLSGQPYFQVPLETSVAIGKRWSELKD